MKRVNHIIQLMALWLCLFQASPMLGQPINWQPPHDILHRDLWSSMRNHFTMPFDVDRPEVKQYIHFWQHHPNTLYHILSDAAPYIQYVYQQTAKRDLPAELALVPFVESHYEVFAYSKAGAVGIWQMMPGTASGQGLKINWWYDGRRDIQSATRAALNYITYLHDFFNQDWLAAIAAYDAGEGTVYHAIQYNLNHHAPSDFWSLHLPEEAQHYLPKLIAICAIIDDPDSYGVSLPFVSRLDYLTSVDVHQQISLSTAAQLAHVSISEMRYLNPGFKRWATDPMGPYRFLIPAQSHDAFIEGLGHLPKSAYTPWFHHVVNPGENLGVIAKRYHTSTLILKKVNHLKNDFIREGQELLVPGSMHLRERHEQSDVASDLLTERHVPGPKRWVHVVKHAETLEKIAKKYFVKVTSIQYWNHLDKSPIHPGQSLVIWKSKYHAPKHHRIITVHAGDSLSSIAHRHHSHTTQLMRENHLKSATIRIGQKLVVPA